MTKLTRPWILAVALVASAALAAGCRTEAGVGTDRPPVEPPAPPVADRGVRVLAVDAGGGTAASAAGFFVSPDGLVVTCRHAVAGKMIAGVVLSDGRRLVASQPVAEDPAADLAVFLVDGPRPFPFLPLAEATPDKGATVWAVTRAGLRIGTVGGPGADPDVGPVLLAEMSGVRPGNSGAAVVDRDGRAVGVVRRGVDPHGLKFQAIPADRVRALLVELAGATTQPSTQPSTRPATRPGDGNDGQ